MTILETKIIGCFEILLNDISDKRGSFLKTYHIDSFKEHNLETNWAEEYFSISHKDVVRGMHFQSPPQDHAKIVTCIKGSVLDVILDLRKSSSTYMSCISFEMGEKTKKMIYIPKGCAHGFLSLENNTLMFYKVTSVYSPENDHGILWDSIDFEWPNSNVIVSNRDLNHPKLSEYLSPF